MKMRTTELTNIRNKVRDNLEVHTEDGTIELKLWKGIPPGENSKFLGTLYIFPDGTAKVAWWEWDDC